MLRSEMLEATKQLLTALKTSGLQQAVVTTIEPSREKEGHSSSGPLLRALHDFSLAAAVFPSYALELTQIMGISPALDPGVWPQLLNRSPKALELHSALFYTSNFLPKVVALLTPHDEEKLTHPDSAPRELRGKVLFSTILIEGENEYSQPKRLVTLLESVDQLYSVGLDLLQLPAEPLIVLTIDSGSDKAFNFAGNAKAIEWVKTFVIELWNRVVFYREHAQDARISLIAKSLPVLEEITTLETSGKIGREKAELMRRAVIEAATGFAESGAVTPEMDQHNTFSPRQLLAPQMKLLAWPRDDPAAGNDAAIHAEQSTPLSEADAGTSRASAFSEEEIAALKEQLGKRKRSATARRKKNE